jgi:biopolymer transport protein TolQ
MEQETMEAVAVESTSLGQESAYDLTIWGLFADADLVVQVVLIMLLLASFWTWAIIFEKWLRMRRLKARAEDFEEDFWSGGSLDDLYEQMDQRPNDPMSAIFVSAMKEWRRSTARGGLENERNKVSLQQRIERVMEITLGREMQRLERQMIFLASVGSAAPFVGLFGTVWGIMNAFTSIAASKNGVGGAFRRPVRHRLGHHERLHLDRRQQEHDPGGGRARHCRGPLRHRLGAGRGDPGGDRVQQAVDRPWPLQRAFGRLRRRVRGDPVPPARGAALTCLRISSPAGTAAASAVRPTSR